MLTHTSGFPVALFSGAAWCVVMAACAPPPPDPIFGVRLGMTPAQVRERFDPGVPGTYRSEAMDEDFALVWSPSERGDVLTARHEFHEGQLVAMRLTVASGSRAAGGSPVEATPLSLIARDVVDEGVAVTWLARSCPTHAAEVRRRMQSLP